MTVDQTVSLVTSIAACLSAIAAFLVVVQVYKQRAATYKPELVLMRTRFSCEMTSASSMQEEWKRPVRDDDKDVEDLRPVGIPLTNVGLGAAKEVKLTWKLPVDSLVSDLNQAAQKPLVAPCFKLDGEFLHFKSENVSVMHNLKAQKEQYFDYVLPASIDQNPNEISIPSAFSHLVSTLVYLRSKQDKKEDLSPFPDIPVSKLKVAFKDIGGVKHSTSYDVHVHVVSIKYGEEKVEFEGILQYSQ